MGRGVLFKGCAAAGAVGVLASGCGGAEVASAAASVRLDGNAAVLRSGGDEYRVDVRGLGVTARGGDGRSVVLSEAADGLGAPGPVTQKDGVVSWSFPARGLSVAAKGRDGRLVVEVRSARDGKLTWPVTGTDKATSRLAVPVGEGMGLPVDDPFWNAADTGFAGEDMRLTADLGMPFWGYQVGSRGVSYVVPTDIGTSIRFVSRKGRLHGETTHAFSQGNGTRDYTVAFALTGGSPVASALDYRGWLSSHGGLGSLKDKIAKNPAVGRLVGAFHAYLWGDAMTAESVRKMKRAGLNRMWLGYDSTDTPMKADAVAAAKQAGYLVGPYDSWANAQPPATADNPSSQWPGRIYPDGCVHDASGKPEEGFHGRGCYLSSEAMRKGPHLADRTRRMTANGADSYFLDVDAAGELFRDHSPAHPMTEARDRANRVERMRALSRKYVLGSEKAGAWANRVLAFDHGSGTAFTGPLWPLQKDPELWGRYWPETGPQFFFKPVTMPADAAKAMYDPAYRLPLYETVLHDSVVNLDRWELSLFKMPDLKTTRVLLAMLYNTPLNFTMDGKTLARHGQEMARLQKFFEPLHEAAATQALTDFRWLTPDRTVQRTRFGDALTVTANFGSTPHEGLEGGCVRAETSGGAQAFCP